MKNVMKNILLLGCLIGSASNLVAMNVTKLTPKQSDQSKLPSILPSIAHKTGHIEKKSASIVAIDNKSVDSGYVALDTDSQIFFAACDCKKLHTDIETVKQALLLSTITSQDIINAYDKTTCLEAMKKLLLFAHNFLYTNNVQTVEHMLKNNKPSDPCAVLTLIPRRFETAVMNGHAEIVEHLLKKYSEEISNFLVMKMLWKVRDLIRSIQKKEPSKHVIEAYKKIRRTLNQEIITRNKTTNLEDL